MQHTLVRRRDEYEKSAVKVRLVHVACHAAFLLVDVESNCVAFATSISRLCSRLPFPGPKNFENTMKFDVATSVLASLLMADPVLAQVEAQRQKKERIMDSEHLEEMEGSNKHYHNQFHQRNKQEVYHKDDLHYGHGSHKNKERIMDSEHLMDLEGSNKLHRGQLHQRNRQKQTVSSHKVVLKTNDPKIMADEEVQAAIDSDSSSLPDVGILAQDYETALGRNLRRRRRKKAQAAAAPQTCFQEVPLILRRMPGAKFEQPYCDDMDGVMAYWNLKDENSFFFGAYCDCQAECSKAKTTRCCAKGCLACKQGNKKKFPKCGQFTPANV